MYQLGQGVEAQGLGVEAIRSMFKPNPSLEQAGSGLGILDLNYHFHLVNRLGRAKSG